MKNKIFIHPSSEVSSESQIGNGTKIWQHCTILAGADIGQECLLSQNVYVEGHTKMGQRVKIKNNVSIYEGVILEDDVFIGPSVVFTNVLNPRSHWPRKSEFLQTIVKTGATIGANATVVCGVTIGRYAMIGAGSVVTKNIPDFALAYGVPAKQRGWVCYCGELMKLAKGESYYNCHLCKSAYQVGNNYLRKIEVGGHGI